MNVSVPIPGHSYDIVIERGGLNQVGDWLRTLWGDKKVCIRGRHFMFYGAAWQSLDERLPVFQEPSEGSSSSALL